MCLPVFLFLSMVAASPNAAALQELFYGEERLNELDIEQLDSKRQDEVRIGKYKRASIYVEAFEKMVNTVYDGESHLLTNEEERMLLAFSKLSYDARYCLVRLILRKTNTWHTLKSMEKFKNEVGEDGLICAIFALCQPIEDEPEIKHEVMDEPALPIVPEVEIIDLTIDSDNEEETKPDVTNVKNPSTKDQDIKPTLDSFRESRNSPPYKPDFSFFMEDESSMSLEEVLRKLNNDQLRDLVKETKTKPKLMNKDAMTSTLLLYAYTQQGLGFQSTGNGGRKRKSGDDGLRQTLLPFKAKGKATLMTQEHRLLQMALEKLAPIPTRNLSTTGKSVRVNIDLYWLIARLNVIYERSTEYPKSLLVPSLLTSFKKRTYPQYSFSRDTTIWTTREEFMEYFEALRLEAAIETELEAPSPGRPPTKTPFVTPAPLGGRNLTTPLRTPMSASRVTESPAICKKEEQGQDGFLVQEPAMPEKPPDRKKEAAQRVKEVFYEVVLPTWRKLVERQQLLGAKERAPGLERFEPGFVYTRMFSKAMQSMATLHLFQEELTTLDELLRQRFWRRDKRARMYERRAVLQTYHLCYVVDSDERKKDPEVLRRAMECIKEALKDDDTHLVLRPKLVRKLVTLEKHLKIPEEDRCHCSNRLKEAHNVEFAAERINKSAKSLELDAYGRIKNNDKGLRTYFSPNIKATKSNDTERPPPVTKPSDNWKSKGKSIWRGRDGDEVNVECKALQHYEGKGYKGFHSETRILTTLFALLFWDILFTDVPGAFETAHQTAPLDLGEDCFYRARKGLIDVRLEDIKCPGRAREIVQRHDELYREKNTWCVGVRWDICAREELLEIVECLGGEPLAFICRLFCEDYTGRCSGVPDLIVWHVEKKECKFVEVKGPGDTASENQKLWFDSLLGAGAYVEICNVRDQSKPPKPLKKKVAAQRSSAKSKGKGKARADSDVEMDFDLLDVHEATPDEPYESPLNLRKRRRPPDENADVLPIFHSSATPPTSPSSLPSMRRLNRAEVVLTPRKKPRQTPSS
ncbi:hypothetical protein DXG01_004068 [Tephrocybe rancida]|nr:hypothetical protein DXG01_004068 [Tephrocybe rancida]